jgi:hypothetical protein
VSIAKAFGDRFRRWMLRVAYGSWNGFAFVVVCEFLLNCVVHFYRLPIKSPYVSLLSPADRWRQEIE